MKNILNIMKHDLRKITGSVVAIITVLGLCIVPCLYAWFNIFSNWSPYESDATGRIAVAVANEDRGTGASGLEINVGDKIVEALEANDAIGWTFVDSEEEAKEGVYAGTYYAALVIPEEFSEDALSFIQGSLINPKIKYYENEKKNAIAPKITGKAQTALKEQVNAAFVETLTSYVTGAASVAEASGYDPAAVLTDLSKRAEELSNDVNGAIALSESAGALTDSADSLLDASDAMIGSAQEVLDANDALLDSAEKKLPKQSDTKVRDDAAKHADKTSNTLASLKTVIERVQGADAAAFRLYVLTDRDRHKREVDSLQKDAKEHAKALDSAGYTVLASEFSQLANKLGDISDDLAALDVNMTEQERNDALDKLVKDIDAASKLTEEIRRQIQADIRSTLADALDTTRKAMASYRTSLKTANSDLGKMADLMSGYDSSLGKLRSSINSTTATLKSVKDGSDAVAGLLSNAAGNELIRRLSGLLSNNEAAVAEYLANPIKMDTKVIWPVETYGSAMAPFYTVLAQWVGALLTAVLIKVKIKKRDDLQNLKLTEWYFGRYGLYLLVGVAQGLIVSLGDLLYVRIQCLDPIRFVLIAVINGIVFTMINYALVFALDNIGLGAGVIVLVLQVAGSGGTYPVEVLPEPFKVIYPLMPFRYSMDAMRECICGMYNDTYWRCLGVLMLFFVFAVAFGLALYHPARRLNEMIAESKAKSEIML